MANLEYMYFNKRKYNVNCKTKDAKAITGDSADITLPKIYEAWTKDNVWGMEKNYEATMLHTRPGLSSAFGARQIWPSHVSRKTSSTSSWYRK